MTIQKYNNSVVLYDNDNNIDTKGAEISFVNVADGGDPITGIYSGQNVTILGYVLKPGYGVSFDGNENEMDVTKYKFYFSGTGVRCLAVFQKNLV